MAYHRERLPSVQREAPIEYLRALAEIAPPALDMAAALRAPGVSLIAECKKASPSKGLLRADYDPQSLARSYARAGAAAVSVLTDGPHFQGSLADLTDVKQVFSTGRADTHDIPPIPVLRKDFIFHPYQVYEARAAGADALLLIVRVLSDVELRELLDLTHRLGMQALVEVHSAQEMTRALAAHPQLVGVNNRDLSTFEVNFDTTDVLRDLVPAGTILVAESGIRDAGDVRRMAALGVDAILVGETLVRSEDSYEAARSLVEAGRP
jgi:indole-3-glycerol phosphate synthase